MKAGTSRIDKPTMNREQLAQALELTGDPEGYAATLLSALIETVPAVGRFHSYPFPRLRLVKDGGALPATTPTPSQ